jgi:DNA-directed RNA polymerase subunit L
MSKDDTKFVFNTNHVIMNTIRRVIFEKVPNYAFDPKNIKFLKNSSIYNNDLLKGRFSNLPVMGLANDDSVFNEYLESNYLWVINNERNITDKEKTKIDIDSIYENDTSIDTITDEKILTMLCNVKHDDKKKQFLNVTTDLCEFFINDMKIPSPYKSSLLLLKLRFGEEIEFSASSKMSIPYESPIYLIVENAFFVKNEDSYTFTVIPVNSSIKAKDILKRVIRIIEEMLKVVENMIESASEDTGSLEINNDKFTLAGLLTYYIQDHKDVTYAGNKCEHLLGQRSYIFYKLKDGASIKTVINDVSKSIMKELASLKIGK